MLKHSEYGRGGCDAPCQRTAAWIGIRSRASKISKHRFTEPIDRKSVRDNGGRWPRLLVVRAGKRFADYVRDDIAGRLLIGQDGQEEQHIFADGAGGVVEFTGRGLRGRRIKLCRIGG